MYFYHSIRFRVIAILITLFVTLLGSASLFVNQIITDGFRTIEEDHLAENEARVDETYRSILANLAVKVADWSSWDDTYSYIVDKNEDYVSSNLSPNSLTSLHIDHIIFTNLDGQVVSVHSLDNQPPSNVREFFYAESPLIANWDQDQLHSGILRLGGELVFFASRPILDSNGLGPSRGAVIFMQKIDDEVLSQISASTRLDVRLISQDLQSSIPQASLREQSTYAAKTITGTIPLRDFFDTPQAVFQFSYPAKISAQGEQSIRYFMLALTGSSLLVVLILTYILGRFYLSRLESLANQVTSIGRQGSRVARVEVPGHDELSFLGQTINTTFETLRKFELALDNSSNHVIITDKEGVIQYANKSVELITGYPRSEVIGQKPSLWGKQMEPAFYTQLWQTIATDRKPFMGEILNRRKDGSLYNAYATISPIIDEAENLVGFVGVERDITEVKQYQLHLESLVEERTSQLKASIENIGRAYAFIDTKGTVIFSNAKLTTFFGDPGGEWTVAKLADKLAGIFDLKAGVETCLQTQKAHPKVSIEYNSMYYELYIKPVIHKGSIIGIVILAADVTEAKLLNRSRDEFFSIASHELRTPLTAIRGNVSLIKEMYGSEITNPEINEMLADIHESSVRLIAIVNDFLDTSRLELGKLSYRKDPLSIHDLVTEAFAEVKELATQSHLSLSVSENSQSLPQIIGDRDRIKQVLINLVGNALKFTQTGGVHLDLAIQSGMLQVSVTDTGRGVSPENQALLFRKFQQAESSLYTRDTTKGTGLGLYISRLMIEGMGGKIWLVKSEVGVGTTFAFTLPLVSSGSS